MYYTKKKVKPIKNNILTAFDHSQKHNPVNLSIFKNRFYEIIISDVSYNIDTFEIKIDGYPYHVEMKNAKKLFLNYTWLPET